MFRHPNYYKNLRKLARNRDLHVRPILGSVDSATDQAISARETADDARATGPGHKLQAREDIIHEENERLLDRSSKPQAASVKHQAAPDT